MSLFTRLLQAYPALTFAPYRRYWFASFASVGATQLITLAQGWLIFELSGSALQLGFLGAAAAIPNLLITLIGGVWADRFSKRTIMLWTSASTTLLLALLAWLDYQGIVEVWHVLAIAAGVSFITGLDWPVRVAIFPQLVERYAFLSAVALNSFIWQVTRMAIPAIGGIILALSDTWVLFALGALGFSAMFFTMLTLTIARPAATDESASQQVRQGLAFIWQTPLFRWLLLITFSTMFLSGSYIQLMPLLATELGQTEAGYGLLLSAAGIGSIAGTLSTGLISRLNRPGQFMLRTALTSAVLLMLFAGLLRLGWFYPALVCVVLLAASASVFLISSVTALQVEVPDHLRGRVMGIHSMGYSLIPLGGLWLGALSTALNPVLALLFSNLLFILTLVLFGFRQPAVRDLDPTICNSQDKP